MAAGRVCIDQVPRPGKAGQQEVLFLFDYGDEWLFRVELTATGRKVAKARYPRVLAKAGPSPVQYPDPDDHEEEEEGDDDA